MMNGISVKGGVVMSNNCCDCIYGELTDNEIEFHFGAEDKDCYCHYYCKFVRRTSGCCPQFEER